MDIPALRQFLIDQAFHIANDMDDVLSINIVGSFAETNDLSGISDIDTVIIIDHLTEWKFQEIITKFEAIASILKSEYNLDLFINSTFGPLKYNQPNSVVYHVMIYDVAGHIIHCRKSPFTCFDWQRTTMFSKNHMSDIHKVWQLMPHHFFNVRRGAKEYLNDYLKSVVSYRNYHFVDGEVIEERQEKQMLVKDRFEFAYHIVRFIMANFIKMHDLKNVKLSNQELVERFIKLFPSFRGDLPEIFATISNYKISNKFPDEAGSLDEFIHSFLGRFEKGFYNLFPEEDKYLYFCRHEKTEHNKGSLFLGQKLNPSINLATRSSDKLEVNQIISSPSRRAQETAKHLGDSNEIKTSPLLLEIDYGLAEGKDLCWLNKEHPEITTAWSNGEDPRFPEGECQADVLSRMETFLDEFIDKGGNSLIVSHNVWLRCLIGKHLNIDSRNWFMINIPHCYILKFRILTDNRILPDLTAEDIYILLKGLETKRFKNHQRARDEDFDERLRFWAIIAQNREMISTGNHDLYQGTLLVPMAGEGSRFRNAGFNTAKPLIKVDGHEMICQVLNCLPKYKQTVFLVRDCALNKEVYKTLEASANNTTIIPVSELTEGQACTCLLGIDSVPADEPLLIAPCDNGMIWQDKRYKTLLSDPDLDIVCWTFSKHLPIKATPEAWGYVKTDCNDNVLSVSVKKPMTSDPYSEHCIIGTFWFKSAALFRDLANILVDQNIRVNNEFYVDSIIELAIALGEKVKIFDVDQYISWGKPEDLFEYRKWTELIQLHSLAK